MRTLTVALPCVLIALALGACAPADAPVAAPSAAPSPAPTPTPTPSPTPTPEPSPEASAPPAATTSHASAEDLAADLVASELALRAPATPADHIDGWAHVQQAAYRQLAQRPEWYGVALDAMPEELRPSARDNLTATEELFALTKPRDALPTAWTIIAPPPAELLLDAYRQAAAAEGIDWTYLAAIHLTETRMGRIRGDSTAGAQGPMQFMPRTWAAYGSGDVNDPHDAIRAAARYLADHGAPGDMDAAIWAYNHSDRYVAAVKAYASVMQRDEQAYRGYHGWQVYYRLSSGDVVLPVGWTSGDEPQRS